MLSNPTNAKAFPPLFCSRREDLIECFYYGAIHVSVSGASQTPETDDIWLAARSTIKPWQLRVCLPHIDSSLDWAIGMASSSGEAIHREAILRLARVYGIDPESDLHCPKSHSYDAFEYAQQVTQGSPKARINHFCCGNHLAHFVAARASSSVPYLDKQTVQNRALRAWLSELAGDDGYWVNDSCGMPCWVAPMHQHARLWNALSNSNASAMEAIKELWTANPILIGGSNRVDTTILQFGKGRLFAKEGADGLLFLHATGKKGEPPVTILVKMSQAARDEHLYFAVIIAIKQYVPSRATLMHDFASHLQFIIASNVLSFESTLEPRKS
ncbi:asparaginase [Agrobacterium vitis]